MSKCIEVICPDLNVARRRAVEFIVRFCMPDSAPEQAQYKEAGEEYQENNSTSQTLRFTIVQEDRLCPHPTERSDGSQTETV